MEYVFSGAELDGLLSVASSDGSEEWPNFCDVIVKTTDEDVYLYFTEEGDADLGQPFLEQVWPWEMFRKVFKDELNAEDLWKRHEVGV